LREAEICRAQFFQADVKVVGCEPVSKSKWLEMRRLFSMNMVAALK